MKKHSTININQLRYYPKRRLFITNINEYFKFTGVPAMQQYIKVYNHKTNGIKQFVFSCADDKKYVYYNSESNLLLYVYKKSKYRYKNHIDHLPWDNDMFQHKGNRYLTHRDIEQVPSCFEI